ncbi:MAG: non-heme iron oxygenase ferredoxin subunit [Bacillota bacterium]|nr:non-heme iron oxygenase ferredoxin subunit [Bacillota bacterium]
MTAEGHWLRAAAAEEVPEGQALRVVLDGVAVALCRVGGLLYAVDDTCSHEEASLSQGRLVGETIQCPRHGSRFSLKTGKPLSLPAYRPIRTYRVEEREGQVYVELS